MMVKDSYSCPNHNCMYLNPCPLCKRSYCVGDVEIHEDNTVLRVLKVLTHNNTLKK